MTADPYTPSRRLPEHGSANPYATYVDLEAPPPVAPPPPVPAHTPPPAAYLPPPAHTRRSRGVGKVLAVVAVLVAAGGAGAGYGVSAVAKSRICDQLATVTGPDSPQPPNLADVELPDTYGYAIGYMGPKMHRSANRLIVHPALRNAVDNLYDDLMRMLELKKSGATTASDEGTVQEVVLVVGNIDAHMKDAQRACGQPVTGILKN
ncbi:hypothetical protein [Dactylosporangium sp. CA-139066]|uniref:hypothetical protein n=1 Tax=Dactylosporangium sp. CA-139066 TaxID=3239930 RepID=UPI003D8A0A5B